MSHVSRLSRVLPVGALLLLAAAAPLAADDKGVQLGVFDLIIGDGGMGTVELVLIVLRVGFTVAILRMMTIKQDMLIPDGLADDLHNIFETGVTDDGYNEALDIVADDPSMLGAILSASLDKVTLGMSRCYCVETVGAAGQQYVKINWLSPSLRLRQCLVFLVPSVV